MPITTENGQLAALNFGGQWGAPLPLSPGAIGQDDQQQLLWGFPEILWGEVAPDAATPGGAFRRRGDTGRVFRRSNPMAMTVFSLPKDADEVVEYAFDFSNFPEIAAGETIDLIAVTDDPANPGELTIGTPGVNDAEYDDIPAGAGVVVTVSGGTAGTTYRLKCKATTSGGSVRVVKGDIEVE